MRQLPLNVTARVTLDGSGNGTASIGPLSPGEVWTNLTAAVKASTNVSEATARVYAGAAATDGYFAGSTTWGSTGNNGPVPDVRVGGQVFAVWSGGDAGALATLTVTGTKTVR